MISINKEFIFIHIHKTGGTSIEKKLGLFDTLERDVQDHRTLAQIEALTDRKAYLRKGLYCVKRGKLDRSGNYFRQAIKPPLTRAQYDRYYKFSFVRNSWGRIYSWYANVMRDELHKQQLNISDPAFPLHRFIEEKVDPVSFSQLHFLRNQAGQVDMDFIGKFEHLQQDFDKVGQVIGIQDSQLPKLLISNNAHYSQFYDNRSKDLVYARFKEEIEYFNFQF